MSKIELLEAAIRAANDPNIELLDPRNGWPSIVRQSLDGNITDFAVHIAPAGDFHRNPEEMRFQNPGSNRPIDASDGIPVLLGIEQTDDPIILIIANARRRVGRITRFSVRFEKSLIPQARAAGVASFTSNSDETITAFRAEHLGSALEAAAADVEIPADAIKSHTLAAGLTTATSAEAGERARRATSVVIRDAAFGKLVRAAYNNRCALCGLGSDLVVGAHIWPAAAPGSPDIVTNGICLCENHHSAYDRCLIWVAPSSFDIHVSPVLHAAAGSDPHLAAFLKTTVSKLRAPASAADYPCDKFIAARKSYFGEKYDWTPE